MQKYASTAGGAENESFIGCVEQKCSIRRSSECATRGERGCHRTPFAEKQRGCKIDKSQFVGAGRAGESKCFGNAWLWIPRETHRGGPSRPRCHDLPIIEAPDVNHPI